MILARRSTSLVGSHISPGDAPLQQVKGAGLSARGQQTQGLPKQVSGVQVAIAKSGTTRTLRVTFRQVPNDPYFIHAHVYVRYSNNANPVHVASGTSPVTVPLTKTTAPVTIFVVSAGNWGATTLATADGKAVSLA